MKDITQFKNNDLEILDVQTHRAYNLFTTQEGGLIYAPEWGIDLDFFLLPDFKVQNASFESYLLQKLARWGFTLAAFNLIKHQFKNIYGFVFKNEDNKTKIGG